MFARSTSNNTVLLRRLINITFSMSSASAPACDRRRDIQPKTNVKVDVANYIIADKPDQSRFEMPINGDIAYVEYLKDGNTFDLVESLVPEHLSGQGLGKILAGKTFDHIISQNGKIKLTCDFLKYYFEQNKDKYQAHVV